MKSPFDILGVEARFDLDLAALEKRFRDLSRDVHPDRSRRAELGASIDLNAAYRTLKDDLSRAAALLAARGELQSPRVADDPAFLMEIMELRESLGDARVAKDLAKVDALASQVESTYGSARRALAAAFEARDHTQARHHLGRMRYYRRFLDEVDVIREENELA